MGKWTGLIVLFLLSSKMEKSASQPGLDARSFTYLALGDSYTIGERVAPAMRWPVQLAEQLTRQGKETTAPDIIARTGWTTAELQQGIQEASNTRQYNIVSLLIGVNNQYRSQSIAVYRTEFKALLRTAIAFAGEHHEHVFVLSIPDWGQTPFAKKQDAQKIAREIDAFNQVAREECRLQNILFIDITDLSRTVAQNPAWVADDGLHYSGKMYAQWAERALPWVAKMLP